MIEEFRQSQAATAACSVAVSDQTSDVADFFDVQNFISMFVYIYTCIYIYMSFQSFQE